MKERHLKLRVASDDGHAFEVVWWSGVENAFGQTLQPNARIELAYTLEANTWRGETRLQLVAQDAKADAGC